ncbi:hypothetical protein D3C84_1108760 [compost metagenome]
MHHKFDDSAWGEELADLAPEGAAEKTLESDALHVLTGVGEVVFLQRLDDGLAGGRF